MKVKISEMRQQSVAELQKTLQDEKEALFKLNFQHATTPIPNPMLIRKKRKLISQLKTLLNEKSAK